jgi:hypothetical protein
MLPTVEKAGYFLSSLTGLVVSARMLPTVEKVGSDLLIPVPDFANRGISLNPFGWSVGESPSPLPSPKGEGESPPLLPANVFLSNAPASAGDAPSLFARGQR